jgi:thiamine biosynthesis lipoprotein
VKRILAALLLAACAHGGPAEVSDGRPAMGTVLEIRLRAPAGRDGAGLLEALFYEALRLERSWTRFDPASDLSRLNRAAGAGAQPVPPELARLLARSAEYSALTDGAFDITVGPLVELWTRAAERDRPPDAAELATALARVGSRGLRADPRAGTAELLERGAAVELGGVAKGAALDALTALAREAGVESALFVFGGSSLHGLGAPGGEAGWRVLVRDASGGFAGVATLRDRALSVSSAAGQSFLVGGRRYGHVFDPRSGLPLPDVRVAAAVAPEGALAEALSKALLVLPPERGLAIVERIEGAEALLVEPGGLRSTSGWQAATHFERFAGGSTGAQR